MFICPVYQKVLTLCDSVITFFYFVDRLVLAFEILFHIILHVLHLFLQESLLLRKLLL